jgi:chorismate mutase/prephenate dehydratase
MSAGVTSTGEGVIAYLGPEGTFTHAAADRHFGEAASKRSLPSIDEVFAEVEAGRARFGVVPVENSTEGAVTITQECLMDTSLTILAEVIIPIEHNLLLHPQATLQDITRIVSHRQSLAQCRHWLKANLPALPTVEVASNAEAARLAAADPVTAAIAGERAAMLYGLQIASRRIQDKSNNSTRFLVLSREQAPRTGRDKTSILVCTENRPGALFRVLEPFNSFAVSLTKIETRPARDSIWAYVFFIDFEGHRDDAPVRNVLEQLQDRTVSVKFLGSYPMAKDQAHETA